MARTVPDIEILAPDDADPGAARRKEAKIRARFWPTVKRALRQIPFMDEVVAAYYAMLDPATPTRPRLIIIGALAYFVSPVDLVPDFIAGLGYMDDASVLAAALASVRGFVRDEHREAARRALAAEEPRAADAPRA